MINLIVFVNDEKTNLRKTLLSILLQSVLKEVNVLIVYKNVDLQENFNNVVSLFIDKLNIENLIISDFDILNKIYSNSKYLMIMKDNEFFYDAFSIENLLKCFVEETDNDFVYSNLVTINNTTYENVDNYYSSVSGKLFNLNFFRQYNLNLLELIESEFVFMSKCFLYSKNNYFVDSIVLIVEEEKDLILDVVNEYVVDTIFVYNELVGKVTDEKIKEYINWVFCYLCDLRQKWIKYISLSEFGKIIYPLESIYRNLFNEV